MLKKARDISSCLGAALAWFVPAWYRTGQPSFAALNITDTCCFKCLMCSQWQRAPGGDELVTAQWKDVLSQLRSLGVGNVSFAGGEPFMRKDVFELLQHGRQLGLSVGIISNGYLLDKEKIDRAVELGASSFALSVDAVGPEFDRIRGVAGAYKKVENALAVLAALRAEKKIDAHLYFTLMRPTLQTYEEVFSLSRRFNVPFVVNLLDDTPYFFEGIKGKSKELWIGRESESALKGFQRFLALKKRDFPSLVYHTYTEIDFFGKYFSDPVQHRQPCIVSQLRLGINAGGAVFGGCWSMGSFGNVRNQPLKEILASPAYKEAHRNMFYKKCPGCSCGYATSLRYFLPSRFREIAYRMIPGMIRKIYA